MINAAQRTKAAAQDLAEADRIRRVTEARAEAEAMEKAGEGIAKFDNFDAIERAKAVGRVATSHKIPL